MSDLYATHKELVIVLQAIKGLAIKTNESRVATKSQLSELRHFAKQGVNVRLK